MKYDQQYYLIVENTCSGAFMLGESQRSDKDLRLLAERSIKRYVKGRGHVHLTMGDESQFLPCDYLWVIPAGVVSSKMSLKNSIYKEWTSMKQILKIMVGSGMITISFIYGITIG